MSLVSAVVDRCLLEYLERGDDQPVQAPLLSAVTTTTATTWSVNVADMDSDDIDVFANGAVVECESELARVREGVVSGDTLTLTVERGVFGTTAATHAVDKLVKAQPVYPRVTVFNAVCDQVVALHPSLFRTATYNVTSATDYAEVPADVVAVTRFRFSLNSRYREGQVELLTDFAPSSTGKAIQFYGVPTGYAGHIQYRGKFTRPSTEATDLVATTGLQAGWERILMVGAAAQVLLGKELDSTYQAYVSEVARREGVPKGSVIRDVQALERQRLMWLDAAKRELASSNPPEVVFGPVSV